MSELQERMAQLTALHRPLPLHAWHEDLGDVLWWRFPIEEPPYCGSPLDQAWPDYVTHWTPLPSPQWVSEMPRRVQLRRTRGWRMPENTAKVDRTTRWGNDFVIAHEGTRDYAVARHRAYAIGIADEIPTYYEPLRAKNLACWCPLDKACHADILLVLANRPQVSE